MSASADGVESASVAPGSPRPALSDSAIGMRAFEKFKARGSLHGHDKDDWEAARRELIAEAIAR